MSVNVIDTIKPKNNGTFPVVEAADVKVADNVRLPAALNAKADVTALNQTNAAVSSKANASDLIATNNALANKANQSTVDALITTVSTKANQSSVDSLTGRISIAENDIVAVNNRVASTETNLATQTARIDNLSTLEEGSTTGDAELQDIRVKADGTTASSAGDAVREQIESVGNDVSSVNSSTNAEKPEIFRESTNATVDFVGDNYYVAAKVKANTYISGLRIKWTREATYKQPILFMTYDGTDYTVVKKIEAEAKVVNDYAEIPLNLTFASDVYIAFCRFVFNDRTVIGNGDSLGFVHKFDIATYNEGATITPTADSSTLYYAISVLGGNYKGVNKEKSEWESKVAFASSVNLWNESSNTYRYYEDAENFFVLAKVEANNYIAGIRMKWNQSIYNDMILVLTYNGTAYTIVDAIFPNSTLENGYCDIPVNKKYAQTVYFAFKKFKWTSLGYGDGDSLGYSHKFAVSDALKIGASVTPTLDVSTIFSSVSIYGEKSTVNKRNDGDSDQGAYSKWFKTESMLVANPVFDTVMSDNICFIGRWFKRVVNGVECMATTNSGSQIVFRIRNATSVTINFVPTTNTHAYYAYAIDDGAFTRLNIETSTFSIPNVDDFMKEHTIRIMTDGITEDINKWEQGNGYAVSSITSDGAILGCKTVDPIVAFYGDSITEGIRALGITQTGDMGDTNSATNAYPYFCAKELNVIPYYCGYGASGITANGSFSNLYNAINCVMEHKESKMFYPSLICINHGTNDAGDSDDHFLGRYRLCIELLHRKYPRAIICCIRPFKGTHAAQVQAAANTYDYCRYIDTTGWNPDTVDGTHPSAAGAADAGHRLAEAIKDIIY
jgi:lysophospholipase L1-like esterase